MTAFMELQRPTSWYGAIPKPGGDQKCFNKSMKRELESMLSVTTYEALWFSKQDFSHLFDEIDAYYVSVDSKDT